MNSPTRTPSGRPAGDISAAGMERPARRGGAAEPAACYEELTAHQFAEQRDMVVLLLKAPYAAGEFPGFRAVVPLPNGQLVGHYLAEVGPGQAVGLVCPDGECSSRVAIRLARQGYSVRHLAGGLREWYRLQQMGAQA